MLAVVMSHFSNYYFSVKNDFFIIDYVKYCIFHLHEYGLVERR